MFEPDYRNIADAAYNREARRIPLYEHIVSFSKIGEILNRDMESLYLGDEKDIDEFFRLYCGFFREYGYDIIPYEECIGAVMPGSGALGDSRVEPVIKEREDFERYPWEEIGDRYFEKNRKYFTALRKHIPSGMKVSGGAGNGIFECVQDVVSFEGLCYIKADDPEMYEDLFKKVGAVNYRIWERLMREFGDMFCLLRFGDDLGYKSMTLLSTEDIRTQIMPQYKKIVDLVHSYQKPFLLHSCGNIKDVMDDLITYVGINAKHSNEDQIAPFPYWVHTYGDKIGNFGGFDLDVVCNASKPEMKEYITDIIRQCEGHGGVAFGTGNSIPDYMPVEGYMNMLEIVREYRGDFR